MKLLFMSGVSFPPIELHHITVKKSIYFLTDDGLSVQTLTSQPILGGPRLCLHRSLSARHQSESLLITEGRRRVLQDKSYKLGSTDS